MCGQWRRKGCSPHYSASKKSLLQTKRVCNQCYFEESTRKEPSAPASWHSSIVRFFSSAFPSAYLSSLIILSFPFFASSPPLAVFIIFPCPYPSTLGSLTLFPRLLLSLSIFWCLNISTSWPSFLFFSFPGQPLSLLPFYPPVLCNYKSDAVPVGGTTCYLQQTTAYALFKMDFFTNTYVCTCVSAWVHMQTHMNMHSHFLIHIRIVKYKRALKIITHIWLFGIIFTIQITLFLLWMIKNIQCLSTDQKKNLMTRFTQKLFWGFQSYHMTFLSRQWDGCGIVTESQIFVKF